MTTGTEIAIEVDDLRSDAELWKDGASTIVNASNLIAAQNPPDSAYMMVGIAVAAGYRELQRQLLARLAEGNKQFSVLSVALTEIADEFEGHEHEVTTVVTDLGEVFE